MKDMEQVLKKLSNSLNELKRQYPDQIEEELLSDLVQELTEYVPRHLQLFCEAVDTLIDGSKVSEEALTKLIVGTNYLSIDFEELRDNLLEISGHIEETKSDDRYFL